MSGHPAGEDYSGPEWTVQALRSELIRVVGERDALIHAAVDAEIGVFDDAQPAWRQAANVRCGQALRDLAQAVDRYFLGVAGEPLCEEGLNQGRKRMIEALERAWDVLRPLERVRRPAPRARPAA